jgi:hypothetical protein
LRLVLAFSRGPPWFLKASAWRAASRRSNRSAILSTSSPILNPLRADEVADEAGEDAPRALAGLADRAGHEAFLAAKAQL